MPNKGSCAHSFDIMLPMLFLRLVALCFCLSFWLAACPAVLARGAAAEAPTLTPIALYHKVWKMVADGYFDSTCNGQNWRRWEHRYDRVLKTEDDAHKAIETMLASLADRYTRFLDKESFGEEKDQIAAHLFGIGIQIGLDKSQRLIVIAPIEGMPAAEAGIQSLDEIAEIDGKDTKGMSAEAASKMIRGPIDSQVKLIILRNGERKIFQVRRAEIPLRSVQTVQMLTDDIGYIRLSTFMSQRANEEMREALTKLSPARGIILDLRSNPGGLVTNAIDICSMFMGGDMGSDVNHGVIVSTVDRDNHSQAARATGHPISDQLLVVLINQGSASASEITSGALHDSHRAELVGQRSFGKGLVQSITRLEDGSGLNMTIARYLTPANIDIHKKGIAPDYEVNLSVDDYNNGRGPWWADEIGKKRSPDDGKDMQIAKAMSVLATKMKESKARVQLDLSATTSLKDSVGVKTEDAHPPETFRLKLDDAPPTQVGPGAYELKLQDLPQSHSGPGIF
jgi:carboxyl-terminal processing protease